MAEYPITSFAAGELSQRFYGRYDLPQFRQGAKLLRNVFVTPEGAATRRPGTKYVATAKDSSATVNFLAIQHASDDATIIEIGYDNTASKGYMRFIHNGAFVQVDDGTGTDIDLVVDTPWAESDIPDLQAAQFGAFYAYIVHRDYNPRRLAYDPTATGTTPQWVLEKAVAYDASPGTDEFQFSIFNWGEEVMAGDYSATRTYAEDDWVVADNGSGTDHLFRSLQNANKGNTPNSSPSWWEDSGALSASKADYDFAPGDGTDGNKPAAVALYASRLLLGGGDEFPAGVFGSQVSLGNIDFTEDFAPEPVDLTAEDAFFYTIYGAEYEELMWMTSEQVLMAGTTNGLWRLGGPQNPISGTTSSGAFLPLRQSSVGCAPVTPIMFGGLIVFVERGGRRIRAAQYAEASQKYTTSDLTSLSYHLTESGVTKLALQRRPWMIMWAVRDDGKVLSFSFSPETGVSAWTLHELSGEVEDVGVIPTGTNDQVWFAVKRTVNGSTVRHIEYLEVPSEVDTTELNYVDSYTRWSGGDPYDVDTYTKGATPGTDPDVVKTSQNWASGDISNGDRVRFSETGNSELDGSVFAVGSVDHATDEVSLYYLDGTTPFNIDGTAPTEGKMEIVAAALSFSHLNGEEVEGLVDEATTQPMTADGTGCEFDRHGNTLIAGLAYKPEIQTMNIAQTPSRKKNIAEVYLYVLDSGAMKIGKGPEATLDTVRFEPDAFVFGRASEVYTGERIKEFPGGWDNEGTVYITQPWPLPMTVVSIVSEVVQA